jgi:hypothetical protein
MVSGRKTASALIYYDIGKKTEKISHAGGYLKKKLMRLLMAKFIPTRHKKFIVLISYSYKFQASRAGLFLTKVVNFNADKCQNNSLKSPILKGGYVNHRGHRDHRGKKAQRVRRFRRLTQI